MFNLDQIQFGYLFCASQPALRPPAHPSFRPPRDADDIFFPSVAKTYDRLLRTEITSSEALKLFNDQEGVSYLLNLACRGNFRSQPDSALFGVPVALVLRLYAASLYLEFETPPCVPFCTIHQVACNLLCAGIALLPCAHTTPAWVVGRACCCSVCGACTPEKVVELALMFAMLILSDDCACFSDCDMSKFRSRAQQLSVSWLSCGSPHSITLSAIVYCLSASLCPCTSRLGPPAIRALAVAVALAAASLDQHGGQRANSRSGFGFVLLAHGLLKLLNMRDVSAEVAAVCTSYELDVVLVNLLKDRPTGVFWPRSNCLSVYCEPSTKQMVSTEPLSILCAILLANLGAHINNRRRFDAAANATAIFVSRSAHTYVCCMCPFLSSGDSTYMKVLAGEIDYQLMKEQEIPNGLQSSLIVAPVCSPSPGVTKFLADQRFICYWMKFLPKVANSVQLLVDLVVTLIACLLYTSQPGPSLVKATVCMIQLCKGPCGTHHHLVRALLSFATALCIGKSSCDGIIKTMIEFFCLPDSQALSLIIDALLDSAANLVCFEHRSTVSPAHTVFASLVSTAQTAANKYYYSTDGFLLTDGYELYSRSVACIGNYISTHGFTHTEAATILSTHLGSAVRLCDCFLTSASNDDLCTILRLCLNFDSSGVRRLLPGVRSYWHSVWAATPPSRPHALITDLSIAGIDNMPLQYTALDNGSPIYPSDPAGSSVAMFPRQPLICRIEGQAAYRLEVLDLLIRLWRNDVTPKFQDNESLSCILELLCANLDNMQIGDIKLSDKNNVVLAISNFVVKNCKKHPEHNEISLMAIVHALFRLGCTNNLIGTKYWPKFWNPLLWRSLGRGQRKSPQTMALYSAQTRITTRSILLYHAVAIIRRLTSSAYTAMRYLFLSGRVGTAQLKLAATPVLHLYPHAQGKWKALVDVFMELVTLQRQAETDLGYGCWPCALVPSCIRQAGLCKAGVREWNACLRNMVWPRAVVNAATAIYRVTVFSGFQRNVTSRLFQGGGRPACRSQDKIYHDEKPVRPVEIMDEVKRYLDRGPSSVCEEFTSSSNYRSNCKECESLPNAYPTAGTSIARLHGDQPAIIPRKIRILSLDSTRAPLSQAIVLDDISRMLAIPKPAAIFDVAVGSSLGSVVAACVSDRTLTARQTETLIQYLLVGAGKCHLPRILEIIFVRNSRKHSYESDHRRRFITGLRTVLQDTSSSACDCPPHLETNSWAMVTVPFAERSLALVLHGGKCRDVGEPENTETQIVPTNRRHFGCRDTTKRLILSQTDFNFTKWQACSASCANPNQFSTFRMYMALPPSLAYLGNYTQLKENMLSEISGGEERLPMEHNLPRGADVYHEMATAQWEQPSKPIPSLIWLGDGNTLETNPSLTALFYGTRIASDSSTPPSTSNVDFLLSLGIRNDGDVLLDPRNHSNISMFAWFSWATESLNDANKAGNDAAVITRDLHIKYIRSTALPRVRTHPENLHQIMKTVFASSFYIHCVQQRNGMLVLTVQTRTPMPISRLPDDPATRTVERQLVCDGLTAIPPDEAWERVVCEDDSSVKVWSRAAMPGLFTLDASDVDAKVTEIGVARGASAQVPSLHFVNAVSLPDLPMVAGYPGLRPQFELFFTSPDTDLPDFVMPGRCECDDCGTLLHRAFSINVKVRDVEISGSPVIVLIN